MRLVNILLTVVMIGLAIWLGWEIYLPINFKNTKDARYADVKERIKDIKKVQMAYRGKYDKFVSKFDSLIGFVQNDTFEVVKVVGNPDDTTQEVTRDTTYVSARDSLFIPTYPVESLAYIPHTQGKKFWMDAGKIKSDRITVPVFQVKAYDTVFLGDQPRQYLNNNHYLGVGSMTKPSYDVNW